VVMVGGAFGRPGGNVCPWAEHNFYYDPAAAEQVMASDLPIRLVPLDVVEKIIIVEQDIEDLEVHGPTLATRLLRASITRYRSAIGLDGCYVHDALAAAVLADPTLVDTCPLVLRVVTKEDKRGHVDARQPTTRDEHVTAVALDVYATRAKQTILNLLTPSDYS